MKQLSIFIIAFLIASCGASEPYTQNPNTANSEEENTTTTDGLNNDTGATQPPPSTNSNPNRAFALEDYRSSLSDRYSSRQNDIPESFLKIEDKVEEEKDLFEGYRIQIFSGLDVDVADSAASQFRIWADTTIAGYQPETYVFFKPPYYRVHVGDFHTQERANSYAQFVKRRFRDAWVVYDRVNPWNVPADTVRFTLIKRTNR